MTAQVTATPGGANIYTSGSAIAAQAGVSYQIADVAPDGTVGPALTPPDLVLEINQPEIGDISVLLPDGTVIVFQGMVELFGQGTGIAGADGSLVVASLEDAVAAAAGGDTGAAPDGGGSSGAFNPATITEVNEFGAGEGGFFNAGGIDLGALGDADPNLILTLLAGGGLPLPGLSVGPAIGLEDSPTNLGIFLNIVVVPPAIPGITTVIQINGIPAGATLFNAAGPIVTNPGPGPLSVNGLSIAQLTGIGITPPDDSDADFQIVVIARVILGSLVAAVSETETVFVKAVADLAQITLDDLTAAAHPMGVVKNPVQIELEGRGDTGVNDTGATAQDLGVLPAPTAANPAPVIAVDGWVNVNDPNDVDLYTVTIAQAGTYKFDIDFGDLTASGGANGRIDDADVRLTLYDAAGNQIVSVDDIDAFDPEIVAALPAGTFFIAVTQAFNFPVGTLADGFPGTGLDIFGGPGDYQLKVQLDGADNVPGDMFTQMVLEDNAQDVAGMFVDGATVAARTQSADIDIAVTDVDGSESITRVDFDIDTPPPGLMLDLNGDGTFDVTGDVVTVNLTRFGAGAGTLDVTLQTDAATGALFFEIDPGERIQSIDLSTFSWVVDQHNDQDFNIAITARTTETNPTEGATLDPTQVATPHAYQTSTVMVNVKAVADKPTVTVTDNTVNEDNAVFNAPMGMFVDGAPTFGLPIGAAVVDMDGTESITQIRIDGDTLPTGASFNIAAGVVGFATGTFLGGGPLQATASFDGNDLVLDFDPALRLQTISISGAELTVTLPQHKDGMFAFQVDVTATETNPTEGTTADPTQVAVASQTQSETFTLNVQAVADKATVTANDVTANEDNATPTGAMGMFIDGTPVFGTPISAAVVDTDGSESITEIRIDGDTLPTGASFNIVAGTVAFATGTFLGGGPLEATASFVGNDLVLTFDAALRLQTIDISGAELTVTLPQHLDGRITFETMVTTTETDPMGEVNPAGTTAVQTESFDLVAGAVADKASVTAANVTVNEDNATENPAMSGMFVDGTPTYGIPISAAVVDTDESESITEIRIDGDTLPAGASFTIAAGLVAFATGTFLGAGPLQATASFDGNDLVLTFDPALRLQTIDIAGSELGVTLPQHLHGTTTLAWQVTTTETNENAPADTVSDTAVQSGSLDLTVEAVADKPVFAGFPAMAMDVRDTPIPLEGSFSIPDTDGSEGLTQLKISGLPAGSSVSFLDGTGATATIVDGGAGDSDNTADGMIAIDLTQYDAGDTGTTFTNGKLTGIDTTAAGIALTFIPPTGFVGMFTASLAATSTEMTAPIAVTDQTQTTTIDVEVKPTILTTPDTNMITEDTAVGTNSTVAAAAVAGVLSNDQDLDPPSPPGLGLDVNAVNGVPGDVGMSVNPVGSFGSLVLNMDGSYVYTLHDETPNNATVDALNAGGTLTDAFTYSVTDGAGNTETETLTFTIKGANDDPDAQNDAFVTTETAVEAGLVALGNLMDDNGSGADSDVDNVALTVDAISALTTNMAAAGVTVTNISMTAGVTPFTATITTNNGTVDLTVAIDGTVSLSNPTGDPFAALGAAQSGTIDFTYTLGDGQGGTDMATVSITVNGVNDPPVAQDDCLTTNEDLVLVPGNTVGNLITNTTPDGADSDVDGDPVEVFSVTGLALDMFPASLNPIVVAVTAFPAFPIIFEADIGTNSGTARLTVFSNGDVHLEATVGDPFDAMDPGEIGEISFQYTLSDGTLTDMATATIKVEGVSLPPAVDLDENDSNPAGGLDFNSTFTEDGGAVNITDTDTDVTDPDTATVVSMTMTLTNVQDVGSEVILANAAGTGLTVTLVSDTVIQVTQPAVPPLGSFADFEAVLETLTYNNSSQDPDGTTVREVEVVVNDGQSDSAPATAFVTVTPVNDAPAVDLDADGSNTPDPSLDFDAGNYTHGDGPVSIVDVDPSVTDIDSQIASMDISFSAGGAPRPDGASEVLSVTTQGGVISTVNPDGSISLTVAADASVYQAILETLTYENTDPTPTFGTRTFDVTVTDDEGGVSMTSAPAAVATVEVIQRVFFIDNDPLNQQTPGTGTGSQADPYHSIDAFNAAVVVGGVNDPQPGDIIYLRSGASDYDEPDGINLLDGQILIGQEEALGAALTDLGFPTLAALFPAVDEPAGATPVIETNFGDNNGIDLASGNTVRGLDIGDTDGNGSAMFGASVGDLNVEKVAIGGDGQAIDFGAGGTLDVTFESIASTSSAGEGIDINSVGGSFTVDGTTTVTTSSGTGIDLTASAGASFTFGGNLTVSTTAGAGLVANTAGMLHIDGTTNSVTATGGAGVDIVSSTLDNGATFSSVSSTASTGDGINLDTVTGSFTANGGAITGAAGTSFDLNAGTSDVTYAGTINHSAGGATGIEITSHTGGTVLLSGATQTINTSGGAAGGVSLTGNTGATINFTNGGLDIDTAGGTGFNATGGGTVTVEGTGNSVLSTTGTAVNIDGVTIGTNGVTFQSVSSSGGSATGIILNNAGSGGFTVTGDGTNAQNASGGTIASKTGASGSTSTGIGIFINNTEDVELSQMQFNDFDNFAIRGTTVTGFTLSDSVINGVNGDSAANDEGSVSFSNLLGTALIEGSTIAGGLEDNINIVNTSGTLTLLTVKESASNDMVIGLNSTASGNDGIFVESQNSAVVNVTVDKTTFLGARGDLFQSNTLNNSTMVVTLTDNTFTNTHTNILAGGGGVTISGGGPGSNIDLTYVISGTSAGSQVFDFASGIPGAAITANFLAGNGTIDGTIQNNRIGTFGSPGTGGSKGMTIGVDGNLTHTVLVDSNTVQAISGRFGIDMRANGDSTMNATVNNNFVRELVSASALRGFNFLVGGGGAGDDAVFNAEINNNTATIGAAAGTEEGFQFDQVFGSAPSAHFNFPGYGGAADQPAAEADIITFLLGKGNSSNAATPIDVSSDVMDVTGVAFLHAAAAPDSTDAEAAEQAALSAPSQIELAALTAAAVERWIEAGVTDEQLAALEGVTVSVADLDGLKLAANANGTILIDLDAAGHGWFIDETPLEDSEFALAQSDTSLIATDGPAAGSIDLLSVLMHELGHSLGLSDLHPTEAADDLLTATLNSGERRLPDEDHAGDGDALALTDVLDGTGADGAAQAGPGSDTVDPSPAANPPMDDYDTDASVYA